MSEEHCETLAGTWCMWIAPVIVLFARFRESSDIFPQLKWKVSEGNGKRLIAFLFCLFLVCRVLPRLIVLFCQTGPVSLGWWSDSDFSYTLPVVHCSFRASIVQTICIFKCLDLKTKGYLCLYCIYWSRRWFYKFSPKWLMYSGS